MARVGMDKKAAEEFMAQPVKKKSKVLAKNKGKSQSRLEAAHGEFQTRTKKQAPEAHDKKNVGAGAVRGVMTETMARVYEEMWPGMQVRNEHEEVDIEIQEESYILSVTMYVGNDGYQPRRALKIREAEISGQARFCREHRS